jgi:tRNA(Arg) A34 adenosine deaminase TadA
VAADKIMQNAFMQAALEQAKVAASKGEVPVGAAVLSPQGQLIVAHNLTLTCKDPTAHAEILAIREACRLANSERLPGWDLYVTLEPCAMCATAISFARIRRLYYGAADEKGGAVENGVRFFTSATCHHRPEIYEGFGAAESAALLKTFFLSKRANGM